MPAPEYSARPTTDAARAMERGWLVDTRLGYLHPEAEGFKLERYAANTTSVGVHTESAVVVYSQRIAELVSAYRARKTVDKDAQDSVLDLVRYAGWPTFEGGLMPGSANKDWFAPIGSFRFEGVSISGPTKKIIHRNAYELFTTFGGQQVPASDGLPSLVNLDAHAVYTVLMAMAKQTTEANPAHTGPDATVMRFDMLNLLLQNLLGLDGPRHPVTVLVPSHRPKSPSVAITIGADAVG